MNEIVNKLLLVGDKLLPEMHWWLKYDGYQRGLASMLYKFFDKKSASLNKSSGSCIVNEPNSHLKNELHKPIIRKF